MVRDAGVYSELFQKEPVFSAISLSMVIANSLKRWEDTLQKKKVHMEIELDPRFPMIQADPEDMEMMFYYLLRNSLEAVAQEKPYVRIVSKGLSPDSPFVQIEMFNTGRPPNPQEMDNLFVPFSSSKPYGTGFSLPIAQLAARKNMGDLSLEPVPGEGTNCVIQLPIPSKKRQVAS